MQLAPCLSFAQKRLADAGVENPALDARLLLAHALGCDRAALLSQNERVLTQEETTKIEALLVRRERREPVARILGCREFWGLPFALNEATLEPRPDSETLVEAALASLLYVIPAKAGIQPRGVCRVYKDTKNNTRSFSVFQESYARYRSPLDPRFRGDDANGNNAPSPRILDLGTGTGCLLLALLHELPEATGLGVDIAPRAIEQAQINAARLGLEARAVFKVGNWLENVEGPFDLIVCNPPYIPTKDIETLQDEVRLFDPCAALDGGVDGLDPYRHLIPLLPAFLAPGGSAFFEVGIEQAEAVAALMKNAGLCAVSITNDIAGIPRCVCAYFS